MQRHFVTFLSPGTCVHEHTTREISGWNVEQAKEMARSIHERHGATPFAFYFTTRERSDADLDSKVVKKSGRYYLGGVVETLDQVMARNDPAEAILRDNMQSNHWSRVIRNTNSWLVVQPLEDDDVVLA